MHHSVVNTVIHFYFGNFGFVSMMSLLLKAKDMMILSFTVSPPQKKGYFEIYQIQFDLCDEGLIRRLFMQFPVRGNYFKL